MIPLKTRSVKMTDEMYDGIKGHADGMLTNFSRFTVGCCAAILEMVQAPPGQEKLPRIVVLARRAQEYDRNPTLLSESTQEFPMPKCPGLRRQSGKRPNAANSKRLSG
jgi:hypothetical protein